MLRGATAAMSILMITSFPACSDGGDDTDAGAASPTASAPDQTQPGPTGGQRAPTEPGEVVVAQGFLLGWWDGDAWRPAVDDPAPSDVPLTFGRSYTFVDVAGRRATADLGDSTSGCIDEAPVFVEVPDRVEEMVGVAEGIDPLPRDVTQIAAATDHEQAVRDWLDGEGATEAEVRIDRVTRADFEGDGVDEVLIEASWVPDESLLNNPAGAYSVVLVRHVVGDTAETAVVLGDVVTEAEADQESFAGLIEIFEVVAVADLDGDSWFEVVTSSRYYEGGGVELHTWDGDALDEAVGAGCGA